MKQDIFPRCSVEGCASLRWCKGVCVKHYFRIREHGAPEGSGINRDTNMRTHNLSGHPLYPTWHGMVGRCSDPGHPNWPNYGGRGIAVCDRWRGDVAAFIADVSALADPHWAPGLSLDRVDNDGGYRPGNVRWATAKQQAANQRLRRGRPPLTEDPEARRRVAAMRGTGATVRQMAKELGCCVATVGRVLKAAGLIGDGRKGRPRRRKPADTDRCRRIVAMRRDGATHREIMAGAGCSKSTVRRTLDAAGMVRKGRPGRPPKPA